MKIILKFILQSLVIGVLVVILGYLITSTFVAIADHFIVKNELQKIALLLCAAFVIGVILSLIYINPLSLIAQIFLKGIAFFYQEFFRQGAKYFTNKNPHRPFEIVVEVALNDRIKVLGFLANKTPDNLCVIFIPTSRRFTAGFTLIVKEESIRETDLSPEEFLKYIVTSGAHSFERAYKNKQQSL